jgi:phospholipid/cholesterol/gamma-HCH transport system substrate-binding protein
MAENRAEVIVGAAVLAAAIGFLFYASGGSGLGGDSSSYPLKASFRSAEGISPGSDVRMAGVKVGTITSMALNPDTFYADVTISVNNDIHLPDDSAIAISSEGLLGGNFVELVPGGSSDNLSPGDEIEDTQGAVSLITLLMKFVGGSATGEAKPAETATP